MAKRRAKGEGSIYKEEYSDCWVAQITLPNGQRKKKRSKRQQVVREWLHEQHTAVQANLLLKDERLSLGEYLGRFMDDVASHSLAPSTIRSYNYLIKNHIVPEIGQIKLVSLRPDHLQSLYSKKLKEGLSKRTVQYIHAVIRRALNQAVKWGLLYRNPTNAVTPPRPRRKPHQTLSVEQAKAFLKAVEDHTYFPLYFLAISCGLRKGELLGLQWPSVELERGKIRVRHTLVDIQGNTHLGQPKSDAANRTITIPKSVIKALKQHQIKTGALEGYVFTTSTGHPISPRNLTRHFHSVLKKIGLPRIPFHSLRHTFATILLQSNVHPRLVQEMLGHSTIVLTLDTYSHVIPDHHEEAANEMDEIFG